MAIVDLNHFKTFLSTLEERQRDCRLYIDHIGDLLEKHMPNMGVYLVCRCSPSFRYCIPSYSPMVELLRQSSERWKGPPTNPGNQPCVGCAVTGVFLVSLYEVYVKLQPFRLQNLREDPSARNLDLSSYLLVPSMSPRP